MGTVDLCIKNPVVSVIARGNNGNPVSIAIQAVPQVNVSATGARGPQGPAGVDGATDIEVGDLAALFSSY